MIISGTVTSAPVQGTTVQTPADENPPTGFVPVGSGSQWVAKPGGVGALVATVTVTNSLNVDFSTASIFQYNIGAANQTFLPFFINQTIGQTVRLIITQPAASVQAQVLWPAGYHGGRWDEAVVQRDRRRRYVRRELHRAEHVLRQPAQGVSLELSFLLSALF